MNPVDSKSLMAWASTFFYFLAEHLQSVIGMVVAAATGFFYVAKLRQEYINAKNEDRRAEETHRQNLRQDEEDHLNNIS